MGSFNTRSNSNSPTNTMVGVALISVIVALVFDLRLGILLATVLAIAWLVARSRLPQYRTPSAGELARLFEGVRYMSGQQFEAFMANVFTIMGHQATVLDGSGDQGVDILLHANGERVAVQCKNYAKPVGNTPVQEVYAGAAHHGCQHAWVVAPSGFTKGAFELARSVGVSLFDSGGIRAWIREADRSTEQRIPQGNEQAAQDTPASAQSSGKVSTINGRVVSDREAYDVLMKHYEQYLDVLEGLRATKREHKDSYKANPSLRKQWAESHAEATKSIEEISAKLDVLEGRNPDLATQARVSRRAELASRHLDLESGEKRTNVDVSDQIRKLAELRDEDVITEEEFQAKKRDLLDRW